MSYQTNDNCFTSEQATRRYFTMYGTAHIADKALAKRIVTEYLGFTKVKNMSRPIYAPADAALRDDGFPISDHLVMTTFRGISVLTFGRMEDVVTVTPDWHADIVTR